MVGFLLGLNKKLDDVRGRIMSAKNLPSFREAYAEVQRYESRKHLMMPENGSSAFVNNHSPHQSKLDPKYSKCIFLGYASHQGVQMLFTNY